MSQGKRTSKTQMQPEQKGESLDGKRTSKTQMQPEYKGDSLDGKRTSKTQMQPEQKGESLDGIIDVKCTLIDFQKTKQKSETLCGSTNPTAVSYQHLGY